MKRFKKILIGLLVCVLLIFTGVYIYLRMTLPKTAGSLRVDGIDAEIVIKRNQWGVPSIEAKSTDDLFFAIGFCHASDRLFQMDLSRRFGTGRLSEVFGKPALNQDIYTKSMLVDESIEKSLQQLDPSVQKVVESYCRGVNYFMSSRTLPPEFTLLRYTPDPWTVRDVLAILKNMEMMLATSGGELTNMKLVRALGQDKARALVSGVHGTTIVHPEEYGSFFENDVLQRACLQEVDILENGVGSNNWVISGQKTTTGFPILANDPHLGSVFPSHFYQVSAKAGDLELSGATLAGLPFVVVGRTKYIGCAMTNVESDVIDYFILKINPQNEDQYEWDGQWIDFELIEKRIKVKDAPEHVLKIRTSRLGPVQIEDGECLARHSVCDYPSTNLEAGFQMNMATSVDDFVTGLKRQTCPALNIVFADMNGNIGYFPTGLVPKRKKGNGELPLLATGTADGWDGFYSEEEKPYLLNPKKGFVVTANNAVLPDTRLPIFSAETFPAFRADRIEQLIRSKPKLSIQDNMDIQTDSFSKGAEFLISKIRGFTFDSNDAVFVMSQLKQWDFRMDAGIAPYLFYRFERHLIGNIFVDEFQNEDDKRLISNNWIYRLMNYPQQNAETDHFLAFVDNVKTPERESFRDIVEESLRETYADYKEKSLQREPDWLTVHRLSYRHPLGRVPVLGSLLNRGPFGVKGGQECILSAGFNGRLGFDVSHMSTFRMVMDFSDFSKSQYIDSSGQSGHFMSPHYDDQIGLYVDLQYRDMEGISAKSSVLKIVPAN